MMINNTKFNDNVETTDMSLAVALLCKGFELLECKPLGTTRYVYSFPEAGTIYEAVKQFFEGKMRVEPSQYWQTTLWVHDNYHAGGHYDN